MSDVQTLNGHGVAAALHKSHKTFLNIRRELYQLEFPAPLDVPGTPIWLKSDVDAWLESRRRPAVLADQPEVDVPAVPTKRGRGRPSNQEKAALQRAAQQQGGAA